MSEAERRLSEDRAVRRSAKGLFDKRLAQVRADYEARGIPARIKAKATDETVKAVEQAFDIASESKGIIAGTVAALLLWFFRNPLISLARRTFGSRQDGVQETPASGQGKEME